MNGISLKQQINNMCGLNEVIRCIIIMTEEFVKVK